MLKLIKSKIFKGFSSLLICKICQADIVDKRMILLHSSISSVLAAIIIITGGLLNKIAAHRVS